MTTRLPSTRRSVMAASATCVSSSPASAAPSNAKRAVDTGLQPHLSGLVTQFAGASLDSSIHEQQPMFQRCDMQ